MLALICNNFSCFLDGVHLTEEEFEAKFKIKYNNAEREATDALNLAKDEDAINKANDLFEKGEGNFKEKLNPWDDLNDAEFKKEKTGVKPDVEERGMGLIIDPNAKNTPEQIEDLKLIYKDLNRADLPDSYDSTENGKYT